ncbi:MAG: hypothetical protein EOP42_33230 [Sphingobacteriaceae bacterium]|nr:MAG: hypothetical protein EOP42_33230 [Sphingobacteriaceae bacterium]
MPKSAFYIFLLLIFLQIQNPFPAFAQQNFILKGVIFQRQSDFRLANAQILNLKNKQTVGSDYNGTFSIKATLGDTLKITKKDYADNYYVIENQKDAIIQLAQNIQLNEVRIVGQSKKQELDEAMRQYRGQGSFYNGKPPALAMIASPITGLYELFGKTPGQARRFQAFSKAETEQISIDKRFNKEVVKENTDLTDAQIEVFMDVYRPSYDQLARWNAYDLINYIKTSARQLKDGKAPPPLKKLY